MYRFLGSLAWLGRLAAVLVLAGVMVLLGFWQYDRYEQRSAINERIAAAEPATAQPLPTVLAPPAAGEQVGPAPAAETGWRLVTVTGRYDPEYQFAVRGRSHAGQVGVEVVTPLRLADGSAVLIDRGWLAGTGSATELPRLPAPPGSETTVTGWVRPGERSATVAAQDGTLHTRRIGVSALAEHLPYPLYGGYLLLAEQQPAADPALTVLPPRRENAWLNAGYAAQWWIFAAGVLAGFGWLVRREAIRRAAGPAAAEPVARAPGDASAG